jgi:hypothetical protein
MGKIMISNVDRLLALLSLMLILNVEAKKHTQFLIWNEHAFKFTVNSSRTSYL